MLHAKELARMAVHDKDRLWAMEDKIIKVQFDDGVLETSTRPTIFSAYCWRFYDSYPDTPALMSHHMGSLIMSSETHMTLIAKVMFDAYDHYLAQGQVLDLEEMSRQAYQIYNDIFNDFTYRLEAYVQTIDILDFIDVVEHPEIKAANLAVEPNQLSIDNTYKVISRVLRDPKELVYNPVAIAAKSKQVSMGQILQCVGPRGFVTDIDSNIFRHPILPGYVHGISTIADSMVESRSAAKAIGAAEIPLQKTEYFNRRLQLFAATLQNLHMGDCGSNIYVNWRLRSRDLRDLDGKYYRQADGTLARFSEKDRHLIGEELQLRSVLYCQHPDPQGVCSTCFGDLALSVPRKTNLGHVCATALCEQASQSVLSTKHLDGSSTVDTIELSEYEQRYIRLGTNPNTIKLAERLENKRVLLTISQKEAQHLSDILYVADVKQLQLSNISELTEVQLTVIGRNGHEDPSIVPVAVGSRKSSLSHAALDYIKTHSWQLTTNGNYSIDLKDWNNEEVLFELPLRHMNMLDFISMIETFIRATTTSKSKAASSKTGKILTLKDFDDPTAALKEFYNLVSSRLVVNLGHLEVLVRCAMTRSQKDLDFGIPRVGNKVEFGSFIKMMHSRSLSAATAFERQRDLLFNAETYLIDNRMDHPMDPFLSRV